MGKQLKRRRVAARAADGFETAELAMPKDPLPLAGATVDVISRRTPLAAGQSTTTSYRSTPSWASELS